ncbi:MAG TPA: carboxymuconolactone decarboxylase family protein [Bacteroidales bacterium]|nr:carboxymuconolactone decarboxylase family protein [Bacteroidales bacterium]
MKKEIKIPDSIGLRTEYKRKFSLLDMYSAFMLIPSIISVIRKNKKQNLISNLFIERLQLAVTEVNGCAACSYAHTHMALKQGMSSEEVKAIVFAQHFADTRGFPKAEAYQVIVDEYGEEQASIILAASQMMIAGNIYGIPLSALQSRLKKRPYKGSTILYEIGMLIMGVIILPITLIHGLLRQLFGISHIRLDNKPGEDNE